MNGLHDSAERAEGQLGNTGKRGLNNNRERSELKRGDTADYRSQDDLHSLRGPGTHFAEPIAVHYRPPYEVKADKAAVKRHVPYVGAQREQTAVAEKQTLDSQNDDHRKKARLRTKQRRKQHTAA